jgi:hypothetical protein
MPNYRQQCSLETGDGHGDMIHSQLPAADLEHLGKCRFVVGIFTGDIEYRLMIGQTGFDRINERLFGLAQIRSRPSQCDLEKAR